MGNNKQVILDMWNLLWEAQILGMGGDIIIKL
jgi:hypothetical protein